MLRHFSSIVSEGLRKIDIVGRLGGEEFAILLLGADLVAAQVFAERLRLEVESTPMNLNGKAIPITLSIGISEFLKSDAGADDSLNRADSALYRAKQKGRNRVEVSGSILS